MADVAQLVERWLVEPDVAGSSPVVRPIKFLIKYMQSEILKKAKGVRDFGPSEKIARDQITNKISKVFESYGYDPIETPILERYELFASKFGIGQESDAMRETFKLKDQGLRDLVLRTEFTVPFARFVGSNLQIKKPFKRYQIGQVFRDGPLKLGRYREFWQCDIDIVGEKTVTADAEILRVANSIFKKLDIDVEIKINNRKILNAILTDCKVKVKDQESTIVAIDKLEKIGQKGVIEELIERGINKQNAEKIVQTLNLTGDNNELVNSLNDKLGDNEGLEEIKQTLSLLKDLNNIKFVPSLARGLAYYTGNVFEIFLSDNSKLNSSLAGGGRYDNMIGGFLQDNNEYPAVGISFGLETIFDALNLNSKIENKNCVSDLLIALMDEENNLTAQSYADQLRQKSINTEMFLQTGKVRKALDYANAKNINWVIILGDDEIKQNKLMLRNMKTGEQELLEINKVINKITQK